MSPVLVDSSALLAFLDAADPMQRAVQAAFARREEQEFVTHGYVIAETLAVARRRFGVASVTTLIDDVFPAIDLVQVGLDTHAEALRRYRESLPSAISFVDRITLTVAERDRIGTILGLDPDLGSTGLTVIP